MVSVYLDNLKIELLGQGKDGGKSRRTILNPLTLEIEGGSLFAILGGSGSGKTTCLNVIANRYDASKFAVPANAISFGNASSSGERLLLPASSIGLGYVTQSDHLLPFLTVHETLSFAAELKLSTSLSKEERVAVVESVVLDLGLKECAHSRIGENGVVGRARGISGGEKRRVSVGLQIISDPQVLCGDEITSGLDSFTAVTVMESVKRLTKGKRRTTVVCSIHQPRTDIFYMFDSVLLLSRGGAPVFFGKTETMVPYFSKLGHVCPSGSNPSDYFVDLSAIDPKNEHESSLRVRSLEDAFTAAAAAAAAASASSDNSSVIVVDANSSSAPLASWSTQVSVLTRRFLLNTFRDAGNIGGGLFQALVLGLVIMGIFWEMDESPSAVRSRYGLSYIVISAEPYIFMIILVERFCNELKVFDRELQDKLYTPSAYLVAHVLSSIPQLLVQPLFFALPIYFGCNMRSGGVHVITFLCINILLAFIINGLAWWCVSLNRMFSVASLIANSQFTFIGLTSGFLVNLHDLPSYVTWVKHISFHSYSYRILMSNEMSDRVFTSCSNSVCVNIDGNTVLNTQSVAINDYSSTWPVLFAMCIVYHALALFFLNAIKTPPSGSVGGGEGGEDDEIEAGVQLEAAGNDKEGGTKGAGYAVVEQVKDREGVEQEEEAQEEDRGPVPVTVQVSTINLKVSLPFSFFSSPSSAPTPPATTASSTTPPIAPSSSSSNNNITSQKTILTDISCTMRPGRITGLMGGSGSGKTTLIELVAGRIRYNTSSAQTDSSCLSRLGLSRSQYNGSGTIRFNNAVPTGQQLREMIGYVQQSDFHLPSLTVFETLLFNASLRLPRSTSSEEKARRVHKVINMLGLKMATHTRVGGEELKGISGGEKRRLSVGVQLLVDPSLLLLDEVTTGLDSFTARHVVETLRDISRRGRTVILSIHAPRYDVFNLIDDIVLLSRGRLVFSGSTEDLMQHLEALSFPCPPLTNPADFALDISSVDLRSQEKEETSRERVRFLVDAFAATQKKPVALASSSPNEAADVENGVGTIELVDQDQGETPPLTTSSSPAAPIDDDLVDAGALVPVFVSKEHPLHYTLPLLLHRSFTNQKRQPALMSTRVSQGLFFALILCCFYAPVGHDQNSIQNRIGCLYMITSLTFIGMLNCIAVYPLERDVFYREYMDGGYAMSAFFLTYFLLALPFLIISATSLGVLLTFAIGLQPTGYAFCVVSFVMFCFMFVGEAIGVIFLSCFNHVGFSVNIVSVFISCFCMAAGFIAINESQTIRRINYISPLKWGAWIVTNVVFDDNATFRCKEGEKVFGVCPLPNGRAVLDLYGLSSSSEDGDMLFHLWIIALLSFGFCLCSWCVLRLRAYKISH